MRLAVVSMIRNETDIIGSFLQHLDALFDYAILMDHRSIDGTEAILAAACANRPGWKLWHLDPVGYHQVLFTTLAVRHVMQETDADFVFFMDADEFINVPDRATLEAALAGLDGADSVGHLRWCNLLPDRLDARSFQLDETIWLPPENSPLGKAVLPRAFYQVHGHEMHLVIGNHGFFKTPEHIFPGEPVGEMLHVPVRSSRQLQCKLVAGVFSIMAQSARQWVQGRHWFNLLDRMADGTVRDDDLIGFLAQYGHADRLPTPIPRSELAERGFVAGRMMVASGRTMAPGGDPNWIDPVRLIASILRNYTVEDTGSNHMVLDGNRVRLVPMSA